MSLYDYRKSYELATTDASFYSFIMAAMRRADTFNLERLQQAFPETYMELQWRYHAPGGVLASDAESSGVMP